MNEQTINTPAFDAHPFMNGEIPSWRKDDRGRSIPGEVQWYMDLIQVGLDARAQYTGFWEKIRCEYDRDMASYYGDNYSDLTTIDIGRVYSYTHVIESMVMNREPVIETGGVIPSDAEQLDLLEEMGNSDWQMDKDLVRQTKLCVRDCSQTGRGIMWSSLLIPEKELKRIRKATEIARRAKETMRDDPVLAATTESVGQEIAAREAEGPLPLQTTDSEQDDRIKTYRVNSFRVPPEDFLIDPECHGVWNMKWCARRIISTVEAVKADKRYKNTEDLTGSTLFDLSERYVGQTHPKSPFEYVEIWEVWERFDGSWRFCYVAKDHPHFLVDPTPTPFWVGLPAAFLEWNETGLKAYNPSDFVAPWSVLLEEKLSRTKLYEGFDREQVDRTFIDENIAATKEDLEWWSQPQVGLICTVKNPDPDRPLANFFYKIPNDAKSPDRLNYQLRIDQDVQMGIGIGPNQIGQALKSSTSASEAMEVANFARARGSHKYEATETFVGSVTKIRLGIAIQHYDVALVAKMFGAEAGTIWAGIKRDWTEAEVQRMLMVVRVGSMRPVSEDSTYQKLVQILSLAATHPVLLAQLNLPDIMREAVKSLGFRKTDRLVLDNDPQEVSAAVAAQAMAGGGVGGGPGGSTSVPGTPGAEAQFAQG